ncbi:DUF58 domain-containing protein [bacterium]|nr:DUF58 domain-containing protein [bacterium]MDA9902004.1 DUF58 domain-containing protein [Gammaproteobacteria bacterium]MDB2444337.1 DUF58 domain-containing protein [Gammaproteobacteria bacterium]MDC3239078.1 DUF58 domain-containing protein [Gammaproteobacteria bacterium]MDG1951602.1 DUF58 domain-containing protein [Gammaproteobacteria bacterium]|tara:strand:+ start:6342 stop:7235 length:894 start_codon:yes stop_codon:yes gene_type:complete
MSESLNFLDPSVLAGLDNLELRARVVVEGFLSGLHKSPRRGFSVEFNDYRHYQRGDDLRHVDWKLYGRTDKLFIKQYEDETNVRATIVLDTSASMAFGSESGNKLTYGITLASALAYFVTRQRDAVGLVTFDDRVLEFLPPKSRQPHLMQILRTLSAVTPGATTDAAKPLSDLAATLNKRSMIIFISDLLDDEERVISTLRNLRAMGNDVIVLHLMDNAELNFPFNESSEFIDMETSESYLANPAAIRGAYLENLNVFLNDCKKKCQRSDIDYCLLNTSEPLDSALSAYMARRAKGG